MRTIVLIACLFLGACGDNDVPPPDPLEACTELGCADVTASDKHCAETGVCTCGRPAQACAAPCAGLPCESLACDDNGWCTCEINGTFPGCHG